MISVIPKTDIALFAAVLHCLLHFKSLLIHTPRSYSFSQHNSSFCLLLSCTRKYII